MWEMTYFESEKFEYPEKIADIAKEEVKLKDSMKKEKDTPFVETKETSWLLKEIVGS